MGNVSNISGYTFASHEASHAHSYLMPSVLNQLRQVEWRDDSKCVFDLGCGNGSTAAFLEEKGYAVTGVDPSVEGIERAKIHYPDLDLQLGSAYDNLEDTYGQFQAVISLEVVEHVYDPRSYARCVFDLLTGGGITIISTPYHGYLKNLMIAALGRYDAHHNPLWDHGHIKFWSRSTLGTLLEETGFQDIRFERVGRVPALAKSMIAVASKPQIME